MLQINKGVGYFASACACAVFVSDAMAAVFIVIIGPALAAYTD